MAKYDLPAMTDYVIKTTGQETMYYVGHSMGTSTAFAKFSTDPEFEKRIKLFFALAPVVTIGHTPNGLVKFLSSVQDQLRWLFSVIGYNEFTPNNFFMKLAARYICDKEVTNKVLCQNIIFMIAGADTYQLNQTRIPVYIAHTPAGTSTQNMLHFAQLVRSNKFQMNNYGINGNRQKYGQDEPPLYNIENVRVPTYLFWGEKDTLANPTDVKQWKVKLKSLKGSYELPLFNHLDFIWGLKAAPEVYEKIIDIIGNSGVKLHFSYFSLLLLLLLLF